MLKLAKLDKTLESAYNEMLDVWKKTGESMVPWVLKIELDDFQELINFLNNLETGIDLKEGQVTCSTYYLMDETKMLGCCNLRHTLNDQLLQSGGHIGYGIRPDERKKGYATELLRLALLEAKKHGIQKALVTCDDDNIASEKVILKNGGQYESTEPFEGKQVKRFWIQNN